MWSIKVALGGQFPCIADFFSPVVVWLSVYQPRRKLYTILHVILGDVSASANATRDSRTLFRVEHLFGKVSNCGCTRYICCVFLIKSIRLCFVLCTLCNFNNYKRPLYLHVHLPLIDVFLLLIG